MRNKSIESAKKTIGKIGYNLTRYLVRSIQLYTYAKYH